MKKEVIGNLFFIVILLILTLRGYRLIKFKKYRLLVKIDQFMVTLFFVSLFSFPILIGTWNPLRKFLNVGEFYVSSREIQFWVDKSPKGDYDYVRGRYTKAPKDTDGWYGHSIHFDAEDAAAGGTLIFNPKNNRLYGKGLIGGRWYDIENKVFLDSPSREWKEKGRAVYKSGKWVFYLLGEGKLEKGVFKPIFPRGTNFTFTCPIILGELLEPDRTTHYITTYFPSGVLKELSEEEIEKSNLTEIFTAERR